MYGYRLSSIFASKSINEIYKPFVKQLLIMCLNYIIPSITLYRKFNNMSKNTQPHHPNQHPIQSINHEGLFPTNKHTNDNTMMVHSERKISDTQKRGKSCQKINNQLPLNLFRTSAEYRKILVTNGKNIDTRPIVNGVIPSLQYINAPFYQSRQIQTIQTTLKYQHHNTKIPKTINDNTQCCCCCCDTYCQTCAKLRNKTIAIPWNQPLQDKTTRILLAKKLKRQKLLKNIMNFKETSVKLKNNKEKTYQNRLMSDRKITKKNNKSPQSPYISNSVNQLILKSLYKFQQQKRQNIINSIAKQKQKQQKLQKIKYYTDYVRQMNKRFINQSKKQQPKSKDKRTIAMDYWNSIKSDIKKEMISSKHQQVNRKKPKQQKKILKCHSYKLMSQNQREILKKKHQQNALDEIKKQKSKQRQKKQKIKKRLKRLQKQVTKIKSSSKYKPFKPSEQLINNAFKDLNFPIQTAK